jgi:predicted phosphodiesterase
MDGIERDHSGQPELGTYPRPPVRDRLSVDESVEHLVVVGDLHSNLAPLEAVDRYVELLPGPVQFFVNGDVFPLGGQPTETLDWAISRAGRGMVLGNHDEGVLGATRTGGPRYTESGIREALTDSHVEFLSARPYRLDVEWRGYSIRLTHGHRRPDGSIRTSTAYQSKPNEQERVYCDGTADLTVLSHTHYAFVRRSLKGWIANTGSTSLPIRFTLHGDGTAASQSDCESDRPPKRTMCSFLVIKEIRRGDLSKAELLPEIIYFDYERESFINDLITMDYPHVERWRTLLSTGVFDPNARRTVAP